MAGRERQAGLNQLHNRNSENRGGQPAALSVCGDFPCCAISEAERPRPSSGVPPGRCPFFTFPGAEAPGYYRDAPPGLISLLVGSAKTVKNWFSRRTLTPRNQKRPSGNLFRPGRAGRRRVQRAGKFWGCEFAEFWRMSYGARTHDRLQRSARLSAVLSM